jgi:transposase
VDNLVVDSSSIEVNRRARRAKTDATDLTKLLSMLRRHVGGEHKVWRVVHIPSAQDEERRQPHRELWALKRDRTRVTNRMTGSLATVGVYVTVGAKLLERLDRVMQWNGQPIPTTLRDPAIDHGSFEGPSVRWGSFASGCSALRSAYVMW